MKKNHYIELITNIKNHIKADKFEEAYKLISEELSMPYIPMETEKELKELLIDINKNLDIDSSFKTIPLDKIIDFIIDESTNLEAKDGLVALLNNFNLNDNLDEIDVILSSPKVELFVKSQIIEALAKQNIDQKVDITYGIQSFEVNPVEIMKHANEFNTKTVDKLSNILKENELELTVANEMLRIVSISSVILNELEVDYSLALALLSAKATNNEKLLNEIEIEETEIHETEKKIKQIQKLIDK